MRGDPVYWIGAGWLRASVLGARYILGIRTHVTGMENLPVGKKSPAAARDYADAERAATPTTQGVPRGPGQPK